MQRFLCRLHLYKCTILNFSLEFAGERRNMNIVLLNSSATSNSSIKHYPIHCEATTQTYVFPKHRSRIVLQLHSESTNGEEWKSFHGKALQLVIPFRSKSKAELRMREDDCAVQHFRTKPTTPSKKHPTDFSEEDSTNTIVKAYI